MVNVKDYTDIQAAIDYAKVNGGGVVYLPSGVYKIKRPLILPSNIVLMGEGSSTIITKELSVKTLLTVNANKGSTSISVLDCTGFNIGDAVCIADNANYEWVSTKAIITDITGSIISLNVGLNANLQVGRAAFISTSFPLIINEIGSKNILLSGLTLDQNANENDPINNFTISAIHWVENYNSVVENCLLINACTDAYSDQSNDGLNIVQVIKATKNIFRNNTIINSKRHGVHLGTLMNGAIVRGNKISDCLGWALFYCAFVTNTIADNNLVEKCEKGFAGGDERDTKNIISNNIFKNIKSWSIEPGASNIIEGNIITDSAKGILVGFQNCLLSNNDISLNAGGENISIKANGCIINGGRHSGNVSGATSLLIIGASNIFITGLMIMSAYRPCDIRGVTNMKVINSPVLSSTTQQGWIFQVIQSQDISLDLFGCKVTNPIVETIPPLRAIYHTT